MAQYEGRLGSGGEGYHERGGGASSPPAPQRSAGVDGRSNSSSRYESHDYEGFSKSRDREKNEREKSRSRDQERGRDYHRDKEVGRDRERERDRHLKDHRDRIDNRRERGKDRSDGNDHRRGRDFGSKRISGFDMAPLATAPIPPPVATAAAAGQLPGATATVPGLFPSLMLPGQLPTIPMMPVQAMTQQATRHARRVYVGGLSPNANEQSVATFFSQVMAAVGGNAAGPGDAVVNVYINHEKKFAFVEMRSVEEASNAMALDGIIFEGAPVKVRRPSDYNPSLAAALGPSQPTPNLNLAAVGLTPDIACAALNGIKMGDKTLTVRRANQGSIQPRPEQESVFLQAQQIAMQRQLILQPGVVPTKIVCLTQVVSIDELKDDEEYGYIVEDMRSEGGKYAVLFQVLLEYADTDGSSKAKMGLNGRKFGENKVVATYYPEEMYAQGNYDG
ncbi:hypothetical protein Taro_015495 [Colocasia esculenta]|uniref:RRM domain-containing protein n=1 Tax=Colocasia esculenta TaxID=4460 RepID=A0A843UHX9_COLES|nr:hypothetical protein [Colocasia esculenta]